MEPKTEAELNPSARPGPSDFGDEDDPTAKDVLRSYLLERSEVFRRLTDLQKKASTHLKYGSWGPLCSLVLTAGRFLSNSAGA